MSKEKNLYEQKIIFTSKKIYLHEQKYIYTSKKCIFIRTKNIYLYGQKYRCMLKEILACLKVAISSAGLILGHKNKT